MGIVGQALPTAAATRAMSSADLAGWGVPMIAYVRRTPAGEWAICAADGTRIGTAPDRLSAIAAILRHDLEPRSAH